MCGNKQLEHLEQLGSSKSALPEMGRIHCLCIIGQIEGHQLLADTVKTTKYEHIMPLLAAMEESPEVDGVLVLVNTVGGDIEAGMGIAELLSGMQKPTASLVLGGSHSIGVPLAVAAKRSFIVPSAAMTIHPVRLNGTVIGAPQTWEYFTRVRERIVQFVTRNSRISREQFLEYMMRSGQLMGDVGTVIYGEEAVRCGLIDQIGNLSDALAFLHEQIGH